MDYKTLKKEELLKVVQEQANLADAVEVKDNEISSLKKQMQDTERQLSILKIKTEQQKNLASAIEVKDNEISQLMNMNAVQHTNSEKITKELTKEVERLKEQLSERIGQEFSIQALKEDYEFKHIILQKQNLLLRNILQASQALVEMGITQMQNIDEQLQRKEKEKRGDE